MWKIFVSPSHTKSCRKLPADVRSKINAFLDEYRDGVSSLDQIIGLKRLKGWHSYHRIRFGDYRVGIQLDTERKHIILRFVGTRGDFYKKFP